MTLRTLLFAALAAATASAGALAADAPQLYTKHSVVVNATPKADYLGRLDAVTPVTVVKREGKMALVQIDGWALAEYPSQIFKAPGVRIERASFDEESAVRLNKSAGEKTVQGNVWVRAFARGWLPADALTSDLEGLWKAGRARLNDACSSCHGAPKADHFTANQWASQLPVRGGRTGHTRRGANEVMFRYLQEHARQ